jgi:hypothetical protein
VAVEALSFAVLSDTVVTAVGIISIGLAGAVLALGLRRREMGYDPMLIISAAAVIVLAVLILATR